MSDLAIFQQLGPSADNRLENVWSKDPLWSDDSNVTIALFGRGTSIPESSPVSRLVLANQTSAATNCCAVYFACELLNANRLARSWPSSLSSGSNAIFMIITSRSQVFLTVK